MRSEVKIASKDFRVRFNGGDRCVTLDLATFSQPLLPELSIDSLQSFDRSVSVRWDGVRRIDGGERMTWVSQSTLWHKRYFLDVYPGHAEFHAEVSGHGDIDSVRFFDAIADVGFRPHFALTKHFNDGGQTGARAYSSGSPVGFRQVFCPEPNSYAQQFLRPFEDGQVSVNADLEYNGGNFIANPGLLCYAVCAEPDREWLTFGLAVEPGQYLFSEYEYLGGEDFALNLNAWGACRVDGMFRTPRVVMVVGQSAPRSAGPVCGDNARCGIGAGCAPGAASVVVPAYRVRLGTPVLPGGPVPHPQQPGTAAGQRCLHVEHAGHLP